MKIAIQQTAQVVADLNCPGPNGQIPDSNCPILSVKCALLKIGWIYIYSFRAVYALFAVAEGWVLLDIGWFVLFMYSL